MHNIDDIVQALREGPLSFTGLKKETGLSNGVLQYHVRHSDRICREKDAIMLNGSCSECSLKDVCSSSCILSVLEDDKKRKIVELFNENMSQREIGKELGLTAPTVNYHLGELRDKNIVVSSKVNEKVQDHLQI